MIPALAVLLLVVVTHLSRNRLLARRLGAVRARLARELGAGVEVGSAELDGRYGLKVTGVRLPLGAVSVSADVLVIGGLPGYLLRGSVDALRLSRLTGRVAIQAPDGLVVVEGEIDFRGGGGASPLDGTLVARGARWAHRVARLGAPPPFDLEGRFKLDARGWSLEEALVTTDGGKLRGAVGGAAGERVWFDARSEGALTATLAEHLLATTDVDLASLGVRAAGALSGEVSGSKDGSHRATLTVAGGDTSLVLDARADPSGAVSGSLRGTITGADAAAAGLLDRSGLKIDGTVNVDATVSGALTRVVLEGRATAPAVAVGWQEPGEFPVPLADVAVAFRLEPEGLAWRDLDARAFGGTLGGEGTGEAFALKLRSVSGRALSILGRVPFPLPADATLSGTFERAADGTRRASLELATAASRLLLDARVGPADGLAGTTLTGTLGLADLEAMHLLRSRVRPAGEVQVDARLEGALAAPLLVGRLYARALEVAGPGLPPLAFADASLGLRVDAQRLAWHELSLNGYGGVVTGSGHVELASVTHVSNVSWQAVRLETIPTLPDGRRALHDLLHASASGQLTLSGVRGDPRALVGDGSLVLADPEYLFMRETARALETYGLPPPPARGDQPCRARLVFEAGRVELADIDGSVPGVRFRGRLATTWEGRLSGRVEALCSRSYVSKSLLLAIPSAFTGDVKIPVDVSGRLGEPVYEPDIASAVGALFRKSPVASAVKGLMDGLWSTLEGERPSPSRDLDRVFERILRGDPDADELIERLIETGIGPEEVERLLADYKRRRRR